MDRDGQGQMPAENVKQFLELVEAAEDESEGKRRRIEFLARTVEPIVCEP